MPRSIPSSGFVNVIFEVPAGLGWEALVVGGMIDNADNDGRGTSWIHNAQFVNVCFRTHDGAAPSPALAPPSPATHPVAAEVD